MKSANAPFEIHEGRNFCEPKLNIAATASGGLLASVSNSLE